MTDFRHVNSGDILSAVKQFGPSGGAVCLQKESSAAAESISSGLYVIWVPRENADIVNDEVSIIEMCGVDIIFVDVVG